MQYETIAVALTAALGAGGTKTVAYPNGRGPSSYVGGTAHHIVSMDNRTLWAQHGEFTLTFGASNITITNLSEVTFANGTTIYLHVDQGLALGGLPNNRQPATAARIAPNVLAVVSLGVPATADTDGVVASQNYTTADGLATGMNGALVTAGVATMDVPRNIVAAWTGAAVFTVTGTDEFGAVVVESSSSGTSFTGKKAFKTVTGVAWSANVTAATVGTGVVLGLPCFLPRAASALQVLQDGTASTGTAVAGDTATPTATTGDVRGTLAPTNAPNGSRAYEATLIVRGTHIKGLPQFAG